MMKHRFTTRGRTWIAGSAAECASCTLIPLPRDFAGDRGDLPQVETVWSEFVGRPWRFLRCKRRAQKRLHPLGSYDFHAPLRRHRWA